MCLHNVSTHVRMLPTDSDMWCMLNAAIKEEHPDGGHAYPLALVCGSSGVSCRGGSGNNCWQRRQRWTEGVHT